MDLQRLENRALEVGVPRHMVESMLAYINDGRPTGGFLRAILSNDLAGACNRADDVNKDLIHAYVVLLANYAPFGCWGSPGSYDEWIRHRGMKFEVPDAEAKEQGSADF